MMELNSLLVLPLHLRERIQELVSRKINLPEDLRRQLQETLNRGHQLDTEAPEANSSLDTTQSSDSRALLTDDDGRDGEDEDQPSIPDTIPVQLVDDLAQWAGSRAGQRKIEKAGLDSSGYSLIALLAGTQVYIPAKQLAMLKAAENADKATFTDTKVPLQPNPYLPSHLSPRPSPFQGLRSLSRQMSTALNILFSIFGSGFAVYVAGTTGAGYTREKSVVLGIVAGVLVGVAEAILLWIFVWRLQENRENEVKMWTGSHSAGVKSSEEKPREDDSGDGDARSEIQLKDKKVELRLRRRAIKPE